MYILYVVYTYLHVLYIYISYIHFWHGERDYLDLGYGAYRDQSVYV